MPKNIICVACNAHTEFALAQAICKRKGLQALFPTFDREEHKDGTYIVKTHPLMPGYVFIYADREINIPLLKRVCTINRVLQYDDGETNLRGSDRRFAEWVYQYDGHIGLSRAWLIGDQTKIIDGPLKEYEGVIKRINRQRRSALVEITLGDTSRDVWLSFQWMVLKDGEMMELNKVRNEDGG